MKVFYDFDDTLVKSSKAIVKCVNEKFHLGRTENDITDWGYRSLCSKLTGSDVERFFESDIFWDNLEVYENALETLWGHDIHCCTVGTTKNLERKQLFLEDYDLGSDNYMLDSELGFKMKDKRLINMAGGIQIGDTYKELAYTNASVKILFKSYHDYPWQQVPPDETIYIVNEWLEIADIIRWCEKVWK